MITTVDNAENLTKGRQCLLIREWLGLTQEDFGDLLDVSGNTVCDWESGKRVPRNGHWLDIRMLFSLRDNADLDFQLALLKRLDLCPECEKKAVKAIFKWSEILKRRREEGEAFSGQEMKEAIMQSLNPAETIGQLPDA